MDFTAMSMFKMQAKRVAGYGALVVAATLGWLIAASFFLLPLIAFGLDHAAGAIGGIANSLVFLPWAIICGIAAWRRHMLAWSVLTLTPLAIFSLAWIFESNGVSETTDAFADPFSLDLRWPIIFGFTVTCLVTAASGILTFIAPDRRVPEQPNIRSA